MKKYFALFLALSMSLAQATKLPPKKRLSFDSKCSVAGGALKGGIVGAAFSAGAGFGVSALISLAALNDPALGLRKTFSQEWKKNLPAAYIMSGIMGAMFVPFGSIVGGALAYQRLFERNYNMVLDCILESEKNRIFKQFVDEPALLDRVTRLYINSELPLAEAFYVVKKHYDVCVAAFVNLNKVVQTQRLSRIRKSHAKEVLSELGFLLERMQNIILILKKQPDFTAQYNAKQQELMLQQQIAMANHQQQMASQAMISNFIQLAKK